MFNVVYYIFTFVAGTFFGSFLNVVADRSVNGESILFGRSHCDHCKKPLGPKNLIPLISFIIQKGKCEKCKKKLSYYYPISEIMTGALFVFSAYLTGVFKGLDVFVLSSFVFFTFLMSIYIVLFLTDMKYRIIPPKVVLAGIVVTLLFIVSFTLLDVFLTYTNLKSNEFGAFLLQSGFLTDKINVAMKEFSYILISSVGIYLFFALLFYVTPYFLRGERGMGGGDANLGFLIGLVNRFPNNILAIFLGFVIGSVVSIILIILKRKTVKDTVPFGPFLIIGSLISLLFGSQIINWYLGILQ
jgi:prepilin signal peptidase PulO-like enzyme (type II secretory pathway)